MLAMGIVVPVYLVILFSALWYAEIGVNRKQSGVVVISTEQEVVLAEDPRRITILDVLETVKGEAQEDPVLSRGDGK